MPNSAEPIGRDDDSSQLADACRDLVLGDMPVLLDGLFQRMDQALKDLADKAESDARFRALVDVMLRFRRGRAAIASRFLAELRAGWAAADTDASVPVGSGRDPPRPIAAVPPGRTEETLALANLVSKAESRYRDQLDALRGALAVRSGRTPPEGGRNPLGPLAICEAFRTALGTVEGLDLSVRLVLYKLFDKHVMDALGGLYARCLAGVGTAIPIAAPLAAPAARADMRSGTGTSSAFERLRLLLRGRRERTRSAPEGVLLETPELLSVLSRLEAQAAGGAVEAPRVEPLGPRLRQELRLRAGQAARCTLVQADEDTLDLVFLLFERILRGPALPDAIKALIARLQIPIAKVALAEKSFFDDPDHPARLFLNNLAETARGWVDDGVRSPESVYGRIRRAVDGVLAGQAGDTDIFARLDAALSASLAREREQARASEAGVWRELEQRERRLGTRALVRGVIDERMRLYGEVPEAIASLVYDGWEQVMLAAHADGGAAGARWRSALATLDRLLWSVQPKPLDEDRRELLRGIPELLRVLRESLAEVGYDPRRLAVRFRALQALHIAALRRTDGPAGGAAAMVPAAPRIALAVAGSVPLAVGTADGSAERSPVAGLVVGKWVEVRHRDGLMRVKLAWHGATSGLHLFVDRRGRKVMEIGEAELGALFAEGTAAIVDDDRPLVDRAMQSLVRFLEHA